MSFAKPAIPSFVPQSETSDEYEIIKNPEQREVIKRRAIEMVEAAKDCEMVIFLDKTARPLSTLLTNLWPELHPGQPLPAIRFVNIGDEKREVLEDFHFDKFGCTPANYPEGLLQLLETRGDLVNIFGEGNVDNLESTVAIIEHGQRLIVDEMKASGFTVGLTDRILKILDGRGFDRYFIFFEDNEDQNPFFEEEGSPCGSHTTLVQDQSKKSFVSIIDRRREQREQGLAVRHDFERLAQEAAKDYASNHRHPATN